MLKTFRWFALCAMTRSVLVRCHIDITYFTFCPRDSCAPHHRLGVNHVSRTVIGPLEARQTALNFFSDHALRGRRKKSIKREVLAIVATAWCSLILCLPRFVYRSPLDGGRRTKHVTQSNNPLSYKLFFNISLPFLATVSHPLLLLLVPPSKTNASRYSTSLHFL